MLGRLAESTFGFVKTIFLLYLLSVFIGQLDDSEINPKKVSFFKN